MARTLLLKRTVGFSCSASRGLDCIGSAGPNAGRCHELHFKHPSLIATPSLPGRGLQSTDPVLTRHRRASLLRSAAGRRGPDCGQQTGHAVEQGRERAGSLRRGFDTQAAVGAALDT